MYKIIRRVEPMKLRELCIDRHYYTKGDCEAYGEMLFKYDGKDIDIKEIEWLANDIKSHSDTEEEVIDIAYYILTEACYQFIDELPF